MTQTKPRQSYRDSRVMTDHAAFRRRQDNKDKGRLSQINQFSNFQAFQSFFEQRFLYDYYLLHRFDSMKK